MAKKKESKSVKPEAAPAPDPMNQLPPEVREKLKKVKGVESVSVDLEKDLATVTARPGVLVKEADLRKAVKKAGFQLASLKKVPSGASPEPGTP